MIEIKWHSVHYSCNTLWGERPRDGTWNMWLDSNGDVEYGKFESGEVDQILSVKNNVEIKNVVGWISKEEMIDFIKRYQIYYKNKLVKEVADYLYEMIRSNQLPLESYGSFYQNSIYQESMLHHPSYYRQGILNPNIFYLNI